VYLEVAGKLMIHPARKKGNFLDRFVGEIFFTQAPKEATIKDGVKGLVQKTLKLN
jgi:hypothetical protein